MSRQTKIVLAAVAGLLALCLCAGGIGVLALSATGGVLYARSTNQAPVERAVAVREVVVNPNEVGVTVDDSEIAGYEIPAGWSEAYRVHVMDFSLVGLSGPSEKSHIMLMQLPAGTSEMDLKAALEQAARAPQYGHGPTGLDVRQVGQADVTIRGRSVTIAIGEGTNHEGEAFRTWTGVFEGRNGPALLVIAGPAADWDQELVDRFIVSIN